MSDGQQGKSPQDSAIETTYLVMPSQANPQGTAFGGAIVAWIDMAAAMAAQRHCGREVVTAAIDSIIFKEPIRIGDQVMLKASVNYVGRTSMEVGVQVTRQDPYGGNSVVATSAHLTFVALDENKRPVPVLPIVPRTDAERKRYENAKIRVKARKEMIEKFRQ
ncbi:MAG: acyl-CoA thioesterase [Sedimentisphaerales bacterium]|nr:acyl-CoA thioesterase [Sedimentisphaerales bacterium]